MRPPRCSPNGNPDFPQLRICRAAHYAARFSLSHTTNSELDNLGYDPDAAPMKSPTQNSRGWATAKHMRSTEFHEYLRQAASKGGKSRSLPKLDACRRNGSMPCRAGRKRGPKGPRMNVPPLNSPEVMCAARCGFTMLLSRTAMELNTRGRPITLTCPTCGVFGIVLAPRSCGAPIMPPRPSTIT